MAQGKRTETPRIEKKSHDGKNPLSGYQPYRLNGTWVEKEKGASAETTPCPGKRATSDPWCMPRFPRQKSGENLSQGRNPPAEREASPRAFERTRNKICDRRVTEYTRGLNDGSITVGDFHKESRKKSSFLRDYTLSTDETGLYRFWSSDERSRYWAARIQDRLNKAELYIQDVEQELEVRQLSRWSVFLANEDEDRAFVVLSPAQATQRRLSSLATV